MAILYRVAPPERRGAVMGAFGIPMLLGPALGPVLSGWLLDYSDWRMIFLINLPIGIVAVLIGLRSLPRLVPQRAPGSLDKWGIVLGPLAFASLTYGISQSTTDGWSGTQTVAGIAIGAVALVAFGVRQLTAEHPLIDLRVFKSRDFSLAIVTQWAVVGGMFGTMFLLPLFLQQVRGYGAFDTGLYTLPQALTAAVFMPIGGRLFDRFGVRPVALVGLILIASAQWLLSQVNAGTTGEELRLPLMLQGAGMGLTMMPLGTHLLNSAPRELVSRVTSLTGALQSVVASLAIASFATILQSSLAARIAATAATGGPTPEVARAAAAASYGDVYLTSIMVIVAAFFLALTLRRGPAAVRAPELAKTEPSHATMA
jgi:EmrB/QacA subfamily drug resistance transporter